MSVGYMLRLEPGLMLLCIGIVNIPFYTIEIKHIVCQNMKMIISEIGPVEGKILYLKYLYS